MKFEVIRVYKFGPYREVVQSGLSLEDAIAHCTGPEASSRTATNKEAQERTRLRGPWFEGFCEEEAAPLTESRQWPCSVFTVQA